MKAYRRDFDELLHLPIETLRDEAGQAVEAARLYLIETYPDLEPFLDAFLFLHAFNMSTDLPLHYKVLTDVIASLREISARVAVETDTDRVGFPF